MIRGLAYCLAFFVLVGLGLNTWMVMESLRPEPGATLVLMGMDVLFLPTVLVSMGLISTALSYHESFALWEEIALCCVALSNALPYAALLWIQFGRQL